jgi:hypothetical protein
MCLCVCTHAGVCVCVCARAHVCVCALFLVVFVAPFDRRFERLLFLSHHVVFVKRFVFYSLHPKL